MSYSYKTDGWTMLGRRVSSIFSLLLHFAIECQKRRITYFTPGSLPSLVCLQNTEECIRRVQSFNRSTMTYASEQSTPSRILESNHGFHDSTNNHRGTNTTTPQEHWSLDHTMNDQGLGQKFFEWKIKYRKNIMVMKFLSLLTISSQSKGIKEIGDLQCY